MGLVLTSPVPTTQSLPFTLLHSSPFPTLFPTGHALQSILPQAYTHTLKCWGDKSNSIMLVYAAHTELWEVTVMGVCLTKRLWWRSIITVNGLQISWSHVWGGLGLYSTGYTRRHSRADGRVTWWHIIGITTTLRRNIACVWVWVCGGGGGVEWMNETEIE